MFNAIKIVLNLIGWGFIILVIIGMFVGETKDTNGAEQNTSEVTMVTEESKECTYAKEQIQKYNFGKQLKAAKHDNLELLQQQQKMRNYYEKQIAEHCNDLDGIWALYSQTVKDKFDDWVEAQ